MNYHTHKHIVKTQIPIHLEEFALLINQNSCKFMTKFINQMQRKTVLSIEFTNIFSVCSMDMSVVLSDLPCLQKVTVCTVSLQYVW